MILILRLDTNSYSRGAFVWCSLLGLYGSSKTVLLNQMRFYKNNVTVLHAHS